MSKAQVEKYAERVAAFYEFRVGGDPAELARLLGGRIDYQSIGEFGLQEVGCSFGAIGASFQVLRNQHRHDFRAAAAA